MKAILKNVCVPVAVILALTFVFAIFSKAEDDVKIIYTSGSPKIMRSGTDTWNDCRAGMVVATGDRIKTASGEAVEVSFLGNKANVVRVGENSDAFIKISHSPYSVELLNGEVMALLKKLPKGSLFQVKTPTGLSGARGTGWGSRTDGTSSTFSAFENSIYAQGLDGSGNPAGSEVDVASGWKTMVARGGLPAGLERLTDEEWDRWNRWREDLAGRFGADVGDDEGGRAEKIAEGTADELMSRKQDDNERLDIERIAERSVSGSYSPSIGG